MTAATMAKRKRESTSGGLVEAHNVFPRPVYQLVECAPYLL
jgi:hypothetical protein